MVLAMYNTWQSTLISNPEDAEQISITEMMIIKYVLDKPKAIGYCKIHTSF